jgi:hypothetical protein
MDSPLAMSVLGGLIGIGLGVVIVFLFDLF